MVLYKVYCEPYLDKYYSTVFSKATLFQVVIYSLMIIPSFFIAYVTNDFWHYTRSYIEQPRVSYLNQLVVQVGGSRPVDSTVWSSFGNNFTFSGTEVEPNSTFEQVDNNSDGRDDILNLSINFVGMSHDVHTVQLLLFFQVEFNRVGFLEQFASVRLQTVIYTSQSWTSPADRLWIGGELELIQSEPFPASGLVDQYNTSPINFSSTTVDDYDASTILSRYNERNVRVTWENQYPVWKSGVSENFTIDIELRYPPFTVTYYPNFWQYLKFAWVQYLAVFVVSWWLLSYVQSFVFENQVILTVKKRRDKVHSD